MDFIEFRNLSEVLDVKSGDELRKKYIDKFVNVNHELYNEQIQTMHQFIDGNCYLGYLWDYMLKPTVVTETYIEDKIRGLNAVYVFWDIHSCERIFIKDYWRFDKEAVLKLSGEVLLQGETYLPEDIYIFDESFSWTLIKTHEENGECRFCIKCGDI